MRPDGAVHPCAAWKSLEADANVRDYSLEWIWHNSTVFEYVRDFKIRQFHFIDGCRNCNMLQSCKTGCLAQRLHTYGKTLSALTLPWSDPLCPRGSQPISYIKRKV